MLDAAATINLEPDAAQACRRAFVFAIEALCHQDFAAQHSATSLVFKTLPNFRN